MTSLSLTTTDLIRRIHWPAGALLGLKIGSVATPAAHNNTAKRIFLAHLGPKAVLIGHSALYSEIIAHTMLKSRNHEYPFSKTTNSWQS